MLDPGDTARRLHEAAAERRALPAPFTDVHPELDAATAYDIQKLVVGHRLAGGTRVVGAKLGLTSRAKQERMQVGEPIYGWLTADMVLPAEQPVDLAGFIHPRGEPEIGFLIGSAVEAPATALTVLAATELVFGAIEIIDSRFEGFRFRHPDVVADNASSAALVLGGVARPPGALGDLRLLGCVLRDGGQVVATAAGAAVLGHPAQAVAWLVNQLAVRGEGLEPGAIVLSGALTDAFALRRGGVLTAEFAGLGSVEARS